MTVSGLNEHIAAERDLLRLLCSVLVKPITRVELCRLVDPAKFVEPLATRPVRRDPRDGHDRFQALIGSASCSRNQSRLPGFRYQRPTDAELVSEPDIERLFSERVAFDRRRR